MDPISAWAGKIISLNTSIRPIHLTIFSFLLSIFSAVLFLKGEYVYTISAVIIFQFSNLLDNLDGLLARIKPGSGSILALLLDHILDPWRVILNVAAISYTYYLNSADYTIFIYSFLFLCFHFFDWTLPRTTAKIRGAYKDLYKPTLTNFDRFLIGLKDKFTKYNLKVIFFGTHERELLVLTLGPILSFELLSIQVCILISAFFVFLRLAFDNALVKNEIINKTKEYLGDSMNSWEKGVNKINAG